MKHEDKNEMQCFWNNFWSQKDTKTLCYQKEHIYANFEPTSKKVSCENVLTLSYVGSYLQKDSLDSYWKSVLHLFFVTWNTQHHSVHLNWTSSLLVRCSARSAMSSSNYVFQVVLQCLGTTRNNAGTTSADRWRRYSRVSPSQCRIVDTCWKVGDYRRDPLQGTLVLRCYSIGFSEFQLDLHKT